MALDPFKDLDIRATLLKLSSSKEGLNEKEAERRLKSYGYNEITEKKQSSALFFISKFYGPVPMLLILIIVLSYILKNFSDMYIVIALLLVNAAVGFYEEYRADLSMQMLRERLSSTARVMRSGSWQSMPARLLVPGDVIRIRFGDILPADVKILECDYLEIDESVITGESLPVAKSGAGIGYEGSVVRVGEATCAVIRTGDSTLYGKTAALVGSARPKHHLQTAIFNIVKYLVLADVLVIALLFSYGILVLHTDAIGMLPFLLIVFLASVPVTLPTAFTVSMALGTEKLVERSILVRRLDAIEDTATMNVLCMDKTGTLTKNQITVKEVMAFSVKREDLIRYAAEASRGEDKDPIDNALLNYAKQMHIRLGKQISFVPFSMSNKRTEARIKGAAGEYRVAKGAVTVIPEMCAVSRAEKASLYAAVEGYARKGMRSIAVAVGRGSILKLVGVIALYDEPRADAKGLIAELHGLGIETKMLTGDNIAVAKEIATELDLKGEIIDLSKIGKANGKRLFSIMKNAGGFANIYPQDKYTIVKAMQEGHKITGMTGDGINDAPALRQAEVGIAVSNATDVAKSAAALVITKDGIDVIIEAVKESRRIFQRMLTYAMTKISRVIQIVAFIAVLFLALHGFVAITPFLLILLMFTNDIANITIATDNVTYSGKPETWNVKAIVYSAGAIGAILAVQALLLVPIGAFLGLTLAQFQTSAFLLLDISDKFTIFNVRERRPFWKSSPSKILLATSFAGIAAGIILSYYGIFITSISAAAILVIMALSLVFLFVVDVVKRFFFRKFGLA